MLPLPPPRPPRRSRLLAAGLGLAVTAALWWHSPASGDVGPPVPADAAAAPLGAPAPLPPGTGPYGFLMTGPDGAPVRFDPCRPVHWAVRPDGEPAGGREVVRKAVAEVALRTGLQFTEDGETAEPPSEQRPPYQPERYGDRWAPVLVAWTTGTEHAPLAGSVAGYAGPTTGRDGERVHLVSGQVALDVEDLAYGPGQQLRPWAAYAVLHELGHLVGLAHVDATDELMHPQGRIRAFGAGDLHGLAAAGSGPCSTRDPRP